MNTKSFLLIALFTALAAAQCPSPLQIQYFNKSVYGEGVTVTNFVPAGYKLIGGGFTGQNLKQSYPVSTTTPEWVVSTGPVTADNGPATTTVYAIGLYDPNNCYQVNFYKSSPAGVGAQTGSASITCPQGSTLTGGGASSDNFIIANYPNTIRGDATSAATWSASFAPASGFPGNSSKGITAYAVCISPTGTGYSIGNFINSAGLTAGSSPASSTAQAYPPQDVLGGGGFRSNGLVSASYPVSSSWKSINGGYSTLGDGSSLQSYAIGLGQSVASTSAPSTHTSAPSSPTSAPSKTCVGEIITTARPASQSGSWTSGNTKYQIYDISVKNTGQCPITRATYGSIFTGPNNPGVSQSWNIGASPSGDQILGAPITQVTNSNGVAPGTTLSGAGVVVYNATGVTGVAHGPTVFCDASCTNSN